MGEAKREGGTLRARRRIGEDAKAGLQALDVVEQQGRALRHPGRDLVHVREAHEPRTVLHVDGVAGWNDLCTDASGRVYAGGSFSIVGQSIVRNNVVALDPATISGTVILVPLVNVASFGGKVAVPRHDLR